MSWVVHNLALSAKGLTPSERLVLAAMAFFGKDDGSSVFPKIAQVAERAGMSPRNVKRIIKALVEEERLLINVRDAVGHRPTEYRIDVARLTGAEIGVPTCHPETGCEECQLVTPTEPRGDKLSSPGCQDVTRGVTLLSPLNDPSVITSENTHSRARDGSHANPQKSFLLPIGERSKPADDVLAERFAPIWATILANWPDLPSTATEARGRAAWARRVADMPDDVLLIGCIRLHCEALARDNSKRGKLGALAATHPHNWLDRDEGWRKYVDAARDAPKRVADGITKTGAIRAALGEETFARIAAVMKPAEIDVWLHGATFEEPARLTVPKAFQRDWLNTHFGEKLQRAFGTAVRIDLAEKDQRAA